MKQFELKVWHFLAIGVPVALLMSCGLLYIAVRIVRAAWGH